MANEKKKTVSKAGTVDISKVVVLFDQNCRFAGNGQVLFGVRVPNTYEIQEMFNAITDPDIERILNRITISKRANGDLVVLQGNRRTLAGQMAMADPKVSETCKANLRKTEALIYENLTPAEELELINDQDQKKFLRSELVNQIWRMQAVGYGANKLAVMFANQLEQWSKNVKGYTEARAITDPKDRAAKMRSLVRNCLDNFIMTIPTLGDRMQKNFFLQTLREDGLLKETDEQPEFLVIQSNMAEFVKKMEEDVAADKWNRQTGGPAFNAYLEEFIANQKNGKGKRKSTERMSIADIKARIATCESEVAKAALQMSIGEPQETFPMLDRIAQLNTRKREAVNAALPNLPANVQKLLRDLFNLETLSDFSLLLKSLEKGFPEPVIDEPIEDAEPESTESETVDNDDDNTDNAPVA